MGVRLEVQLPAPLVGYVRVELGGRRVVVNENLLDAAKVGPALEQVWRARGLVELSVERRRRGDAVRGLDQPIGLAGRERPRQLPRAARQLDRRGGIVLARPDQLLVAVEGARGGGPARDRRGRKALRPQSCRV